MDFSAEQVKRLSGIHGKIATDVWPGGTRLICDRCGRVLAASKGDCGRYLAKGWPTCCGETMMLERETP